MAKCTKTQKLTTSQSTQERTVDLLIKEGLLFSAVRMLNSQGLQLTEKQLSLLRKYHPTLESLFHRQLRSNSATHTAGSWGNFQIIKRTTSRPKSGKSISTSEQKAIRPQRSGRTGSKTKR